jgi:hypothetical protein
MIPATPVIEINESLQFIFLWITVVLCVVVTGVSVGFSIRYKSAVPVLMVLGGLAAILMEPVVTMLGHAVHPQLGQIQMFESVDRHIPWHIALGYMAGFGILYLILFAKQAAGTLTSPSIWKIFLVTALCYYLGEAYPVEHGLWGYFGYQPLWIWKGTAPPTWSILNATCMLTSATLMLKMIPYLKGIFQLLLIPLAVAGAFMGHMGAGFPMYNAMNSAAPHWLMEASGLASIGMALLLVWVCTLLLTSDGHPARRFAVA